MDAFLKMDVFFVVATAAVVVVAALVGVLLYRAIRLMRTLERIASEVQEEAGEIRADLRNLRQDVLARGLRFAPFLGMFGKIAKRAVKKKFSRKKTT